MNAERLHVIALAIRDEFNKLKIQNTLKALVDSLQKQVSQPNQPAHQQNVSANLQTLTDALSKSTTNEFTPAWSQVVEEIGGGEFIGKRLLQEIQNIFERNNITPSVAHEELNQIHDRLSRFIGALNPLIKSFDVLNIGTEELEPGECELGIVIPRSEVENALPSFGKELVELNKIFSVFSEIATGSRESFKIRTISSSDLTVFLEFLPQTAACAAISIERIIALYKQLLEIRKLKGDLEKQGVPENRTAGIDAHANSLMQNGLTELIDELIEKYHSNEDVGRENELKIEAKYALNKLAKRIDKGYGIDVRIEPYIGDEDIEDDPAEEIANTIISASKNIQYIKLDGDPILTLPESSDEDQE